jgi:hypothetical protein
MDRNEDSKDEIVETLLIRKDSYRASDEDMRLSGYLLDLRSELNNGAFPTITRARYNDQRTS